MATEYENFQVVEDDGLWRVTIDSTSKMNALNRTMTEELTSLGARIDDEDPRAVLLRGSDGVFCAGGDIMDIGGADAPTPSQGFRKGAAAFHDAILHIHQSEVPLVVGVDGPAVGAGLSIAMLGDYVVAHEDAYFQFGYPRIGMTGDGGTTFFLPRIVGMREAKRIALLNNRIPAPEALDRGLITETATDDAYEDRLDEVAREVAEGPSVALGKTLRLIEESHSNDIAQQLAAETEAMAEAARTDDHIEGITAFAEKRDPEFSGE
jgi:2-(1,2-epoxy-1,2-dihydrophenyl)acetyl-CoA isomerase